MRPGNPSETIVICLTGGRTASVIRLRGEAARKVAAAAVAVSRDPTAEIPAGAPPRTKDGQGHGLSPRQVEVVRLVALGKTSKEIGKQLGISFKTVVAHKSNLALKIGAHCAADMARFAVKHRIIEL